MHLMTVKTIEYSCRPWAPLQLDGHADAMDRILDALEADPRALGPVVGYDDDTGRVGAIFQVEVAEYDGDRPDTRTAAARLAGEVFDAALAAAGLEQRTRGLAIVEGDDPDQLP